ncbi:MAG: hypothetical protein U1D30_06650 [Planctomycetota bacterium]
MKATPDFIVAENGKTDKRILLYDCREKCPEDEIVHTTIELFHYVLDKNGLGIPISSIEYVFLQEDRSVIRKKARTTTIKRAKETSAAIAALWEWI